MHTARFALLAAACAAAFAAPADASPYCADLGPVPGYGPVCTVRCVLANQPEADVKDVKGTLASLVPVCPA